MEITSDVTFKSAKWRKLADYLVDKYEIIPTYVGLFLLCASIGVCDGKQEPNETNEDASIKEVNCPRAVLLQKVNSDKLDFIFRAYLFSNEKDMPVEKKIEIAFRDDEDKLFKKIDPIRLCANYGATVLIKSITDFNNAYTTMEEVLNTLKDKSLDADSLSSMFNDEDFDLDD